MTRNISTTARRTVLSTLAALVLASASSQAGFAHSSYVTVERTPQGLMATVQDLDAKGKPVGSKSVTMMNGKPESGADTFSIRRVGSNIVEFTRWKDGKAVMTGRSVPSGGLCNFRCQSGIADKRRPQTFITTDVHESAQQIASGKQ